MPKLNLNKWKSFYLFRNYFSKQPGTEEATVKKKMFLSHEASTLGVSSFVSQLSVTVTRYLR
jgi:hypothetical protein